MTQTYKNIMVPALFSAVFIVLLLSVPSGSAKGSALGSSVIESNPSTTLDDVYKNDSHLVKIIKTGQNSPTFGFYMNPGISDLSEPNNGTVVKKTGKKHTLEDF